MIVRRFERITNEGVGMRGCYNMLPVRLTSVDIWNLEDDIRQGGRALPYLHVTTTKRGGVRGLLERFLS